jgi:hypothetical protein
MAAAYTVIPAWPGRQQPNWSTTDDRWVTNGSTAGFPIGRAGSPIGRRRLAAPLQHGAIAPGLARAELRQQARPRL